MQEEATSRLRPKSRRECVQTLGPCRGSQELRGGCSVAMGPGDRPQGGVPEPVPLELGHGQSPTRALLKGTMGHRRPPQEDRGSCEILFLKTLIPLGRGLQNGIFYFIFNLFIHETHTEKERERGRDTGRGRGRLHAGSPTWDSILSLQDHGLG